MPVRGAEVRLVCGVRSAGVRGCSGGRGSEVRGPKISRARTPAGRLDNGGSEREAKLKSTLRHKLVNRLCLPQGSWLPSASTHAANSASSQADRKKYDVAEGKLGDSGGGVQLPRGQLFAGGPTPRGLHTTRKHIKTLPCVSLPHSLTCNRIRRVVGRTITRGPQGKATAGQPALAGWSGVDASGRARHSYCPHVREPDLNTGALGFF